MFFSKLCLSGRYFKNGMVCSVERLLLASQTHSSCASAGSTQHSKTLGDDKLNIIIRVWRDAKGKLELAPYGKQLDKETGELLTKSLKLLKPDVKLGDTIVVPNVVGKTEKFAAAALTICGPKNPGTDTVEALNLTKENIRCCFAAGYKALKAISCDLCHVEYTIDSEEEAQTAHEGFQLVHWTPEENFDSSRDERYSSGYDIGVDLAEAQNWARYLSQLPPNKMTPDLVVKQANNLATKELGVKVTSYNEKDIKDPKKKINMNAFLEVAHGSIASPMLLECEYTGNKADKSHVLVVAKGVTFDSGGLCLRSPADLLQHNGMTGAAVALGVMRGLASLKAPVNVKLVIPLCENMISGSCVRVGDVLTTRKGLKVKVDDTAMVGHVLLAEALSYGQQHAPSTVISIAALTPGIATATGSACYGCFTKNENLWTVTRTAGQEMGDRPWRFPIWDFYGNQITGDTPALFDLTNRGSGVASHCIGAAFLEKFVDSKNWLHYDITGVGKMTAKDAPLYLNPDYMTGRPTRALIQTIMTLKKKGDSDCFAN